MNCPCNPATSDTCQLTDIFYSVGGADGETLLRIFDNMVLRDYDGSPRAARTIWRECFDRNLHQTP